MSKIPKVTPRFGDRKVCVLTETEPKSGRIQENFRTKAQRAQASQTADSPRARCVFRGICAVPFGKGAQSRFPDVGITKAQTAAYSPSSC